MNDHDLALNKTVLIVGDSSEALKHLAMALNGARLAFSNKAIIKALQHIDEVMGEVEDFREFKLMNIERLQESPKQLLKQSQPYYKRFNKNFSKIKNYQKL